MLKECKGAECQSLERDAVRKAVNECEVSGSEIPHWGVDLA